MDYPERSLMSVLIWAKRKLEFYGLHDWKVVIDPKTTRRLGQCRYYEKTIGIAESHINNHEMSQVVDTIMHEIAHALVGPNHGHDQVWQEMAIKVGATPKAKASVTPAKDAIDDGRMVPCIVMIASDGKFIHTSEISKAKYTSYMKGKRDIKATYLKNLKAYTLGRLDVAMIKREEMVRSVFHDLLS